MKIERQMAIKRIVAIGDVHGSLDLLQELVEDVIRFDPMTDQLVFLGDYIDRGAKSRQVLEYLQTLKRNHADNIILLMGNHEAMCRDFFMVNRNSSPADIVMARTWLLANGGAATLDCWQNDKEAEAVLVPFINSLMPFYETDSHVFVHAGVPKGIANLSKASLDDLLWDRSMEWQGGKTLVVGHTVQKSVTKFGNIVLVDTGAFATGRLSAYDVLNDKVYEAVRMTANSILKEMGSAL